MKWMLSRLFTTVGNRSLIPLGMSVEQVPQNQPIWGEKELKCLCINSHHPYLRISSAIHSSTLQSAEQNRSRCKRVLTQLEVTGLFYIAIVRPWRDMEGAQTEPVTINSLFRSTCAPCQVHSILVKHLQNTKHIHFWGRGTGWTYNIGI